ncbi:MAG: ATP-dependent DNA helicase RecG [Thermoleophilia bacterium]|nr:ATP-dependent DNA helicase RecG [Thermoleophilia bacterium]
MTISRCLHYFASSEPLQPSRLPRTFKAAFNPRELRDPLVVLAGVGPATAGEAARLGLDSLGDLLFHFPRRHEDFTSQKKIGELKWGEEATVRAALQGKPVIKRTRRRNLRLVQAQVGDDTGYMKAAWFNQDYLAELDSGEEMLLRGVYDGMKNTFTVKSHEMLGKEEAGLHTTGYVPVYPTTEKISVKRLRGWLARIRNLAPLLPDPLPASLRAGLELPLRADAILSMHFPRSLEDFKAAERRMIFEELYLMQAGLFWHRHHYERLRRGSALGPAGEKTRGFIGALPFNLTAGQKKACSEISRDLQRETPMQRLLQGDVGSGKTVVAVYSMLRAVEHGCQAALMAPTEVLAEQHWLKLNDMLRGLGVRLDFFSSRLKTAERKKMLESTEAGKVDIAVGTHALIQEDVRFRSLRVVVVDEQHRFGVWQREQLADKATSGGITPHVLHMTATPIPRTLALTLYGDLDVSTIKHLPAGRRQIKTWLVPDSKRAGAYDYIRKQLDAGRQCYVVCPLVEESESVQATAVEAEAGRLKDSEFAGYCVAILHGQMTAAAKQSTMRRFAAGGIQVLVTTTVIEVGVDVPNATVMMVEEADRFGLAQLHQLRGRVGRSSHESYCLLFGDPKTEQARRRLEAIVKIRDGFRLADIDLEIRGEGQLFGVRQSGLPDLRLARLTRDQELLILAREKARVLIGGDPSLKRPENALLRDEIAKVFGESVDWLRKI